MNFDKYICDNIKTQISQEKPWTDINALTEHLEKSVIPNDKMEEWKYFSTSKNLKEDWSLSQKKEIQSDMDKEKVSKNSIVLVDGVFHSKYSNMDELKGVNIYSISEYLNIDSSIKNLIYNNPYKYAEQRVSGKNDINTTSLISLNALFNKGLVIVIKENTEIKGKINLVNIIKNNNLLVNPYILVLCQEGSSANIIDIRKYYGEDNWINTCMEIYQYKNAKLLFSTLQSETKKNISTSSINFHLSKEAFLSMFVLNRENSKSDIRVFLKETNAQAKISGILLSSKRKESDIFCKVEHSSKKCSSEQNWRLLSADSSTTSVKGKIVVKKNAKGSNGKFYSKSMILGDEAASYSKPELEIFEDEVSCNHGASFGEIDKNLIFYMQSRGISKNEAIKVIIKAFVNEVISDDKEILDKYLLEMEDFFRRNLQ